MAPTSMDVKLISCKDLRAFNFFQKLSVYSTISIKNQDPKTHKTTQRFQQQKTPVDRDGDANPEWNHQAKFDLTKLPSSDLVHMFLEFDLLSEGLVFGNKSIGHVRVPIKELIQESKGVVRFVSYQVMSSDGKPDNGILDFSYKVVDDSPSPSPSPWQGYPQVIYPKPEELVYPPVPPPQQTTHYPPQPPGIYPKPEELVYPPVPPPQTTHYPPQPLEIYYTSPPQTPHYPPPAPEVYYTSPPQTPHYPPQQDYYAPPQPVVYPAPYYGEQQFGAYNGETWQNGRGGELGVGPWGAGQMR